MKFLKLFILTLIIYSCNAPRAVYDYDQQARFSDYSTYSFFPNLHSGLSQLDEKRLLTSIENGLREEGFSHSQDPDIYVNVYVEEYEEAGGSNLGVGIGGGGGNVGVGMSGGIPIGGPDTFLRITFDFIDVEDDSLVWQSEVDSKFDRNARPGERQERFDRIVKKALAGYPPKD